MKLKYIGLSVLLVVATINFTRTTLEIIKSSKRLDGVKGEISLLEQEKLDLEKSIEYKKSDEFIEEAARNELNMIKPGENAYVISGLSTKENEAKKEGSGVLSAVSVRKNAPTLAQRVNNLKLWWKLLF